MKENFTIRFKGKIEYFFRLLPKLVYFVDPGLYFSCILIFEKYEK